MVYGFCCSLLLVVVTPPALLAQVTTYQAVPAADAATVSGRVVFTGQVPAPKLLLITKDEDVCGEGYRERHEVTASSGGGLQGVVVFIEGIGQGKEWSDAGDAYTLDQRDCAFQPNLQVVPNGAELNIVNSDPVLHNIHSYELIGRARRTMFNFGQPPEKGTITKVLRPRRGNQVRLECDAHDFMQGWIYVADNPYYAVVAADGTFLIDGVPPGTYTVNAWHPYLGVHHKEVTLEAEGASEITFEFDAR